MKISEVGNWIAPFVEVQADGVVRFNSVAKETLH